MKFKNISGFRQVIVQEGKKVVVFADDVIEVSHDLINAAFEKVAENSTVTFKARSIKKPASNQENLAIVQEIRNASASTEDVVQAVSKINELESVVSKSQSEQGIELSNLKREFTEFKTLALKRMEILKSAVKTLEFEVGQLYTDEDSEGDKGEDTFRQQ